MLFTCYKAFDVNTLTLALQYVINKRFSSLFGFPFDKTMILVCFNIGLKHGFPCINSCQVSREVLQNEVEDRGL